MRSSSGDLTVPAVLFTLARKVKRARLVERVRLVGALAITHGSFVIWLWPPVIV